MSDIKRLCSKLVKSDHWYWQAGSHFRLNGTTVPYKRASWLLASGAVLEQNDLVVSTCGVENCCNPEHLQVVRRGTLATRPPEKRGELYPLAEGQPPIEGTTTRRPINQLSPKQLKNFFEKVNKTDSCWLWTGHTTETSRGKVKLYGVEHTAPRVSYALHYGFDPGNFYVLHTCDDPNCVNPEHLYLGTAQDNADDMLAKGRFRASYGNMKIQPGSPQEKVLLDPEIPVTIAAEMLGIDRHAVWKRRRAAGTGTTTPGRNPKLW
jgi:hypothetical protein